MIKKIWPCLLLSAGLFSCTAGPENTEPEYTQDFDVQKYLESFDSVKCWTTQFQSSKNKTTDQSWGTDVVYLGVYFVTPDSIYQFSYPCDLWRTSAYRIQGDELLISGLSSKQFYVYGDTIELNYEQPYKSSSLEDSITLEIQEIYAKQNVSASILLDLINIKHNEECDTMHGIINQSRLKHFESLMDRVAF